MPVGFVTTGDLEGGNRYAEDDQRMDVHYHAFNNYDHLEGIFMVGVTSPEGFRGQNAAFVQLCDRTLVWVFRWTTACFGEKPKAPDPRPLNEDWVLLQRLPEIPIVTVGPDGETPLRRLTGTYVYGKRTSAKDPFTDTSFPRPMFLEDAFDRVTGNLQYVRGMGDAIAGDGSNNYAGQITGFATGR